MIIDSKLDSSKKIFVLVVMILVVCWLEVLVFWKKIPPQVPWFYSNVWGEGQLMNKGGLIWVLGVASGLSLATSFMASWTKKDDLVIEKTIYITLVLASVLLLLDLSRVLMIFVK